MKSILFLITVFSFNALAVPLQSLPAKVVALHQALNSGCDAEEEANSSVYDLGNDRALYLVPCVMGAYQGYSHGYFSQGKDPDMYVQPIMPLSYNELTKGIEASFELGNAEYDEENKLLNVYTVGRGTGDCGQSSITQVVVSEYGVYFKTIEVRSKSECDGKATPWPVVFEQK